MKGTVYRRGKRLWLATDGFDGTVLRMASGFHVGHEEQAHAMLLELERWIDQQQGRRRDATEQIKKCSICGSWMSLAADNARGFHSEHCEHVFHDADSRRVYLYCQRGCGTRDPLEPPLPVLGPSDPTTPHG